MKRVSIDVTDAQFTKLLQLREIMAKNVGHNVSYASVMREIVAWGLDRFEEWRRLEVERGGTR